MKIENKKTNRNIYIRKNLFKIIGLLYFALYEFSALYKAQSNI